MEEGIHIDCEGRRESCGEAHEGEGGSKESCRNKHLDLWKDCVGLQLL